MVDLPANHAIDYQGGLLKRGFWAWRPHGVEKLCPRELSNVCFCSTYVPNEIPYAMFETVK